MPTQHHFMDYKRIVTQGESWVEDKAFIYAQNEISRAQGVADAMAAEIKHLREIAMAVSALGNTVQLFDERLKLATAKREKPVLLHG